MELDGRESAWNWPPTPSDAPPGGGGGMAAGEREEPRGGAPAAGEGPPAPEEAEELPGLGPGLGQEAVLVPCPGLPGSPLRERPDPGPGALPQGSPRELPPRGKCLLDNWQEERATNPLDRVPDVEGVTEGFVFRHGHRGLLTLDCLASSATGTTMKDAYRRPWRTGLPVRGQRAAMLEWLLFQKHSKDIFGEKVAVAPSPMEPQSITHRDYCREGFRSVPPAPTQPHDYRLEKPQTFWMEHARQVPGVSSVQTKDAPFKRCARFTTPITEYLDQPMPHNLEN